MFNLKTYSVTMDREFKKGETYFVNTIRVDGTEGFGIFRPTRTQNENDNWASGLINCQSFSNMNNHWHKNDVAFIRKSDGANTYPWTKVDSISVHNRPTRIATEQEKLILDYVLQRDEALTTAEIRDIKINTILR
jgi:hypothetical protein